MCHNYLFKGDGEYFILASPPAFALISQSSLQALQITASEPLISSQINCIKTQMKIQYHQISLAKGIFSRNQVAIPKF
jgi:hypothetical protein